MNRKGIDKKQKNRVASRIVRRFLLVLFSVIIMAVSALLMVMNLIFNGPSPTARNLLTMTLIEASATKWVPALFIGEDMVAEIRSSCNIEFSDEVTDVSAVVINRGETVSIANEWEGHPDGIIIESVDGDSFDATVMIVRDPSKVYLGLSTYEGYSTRIPGKRLNVAIEDEGAIAAVNAGAFNDDGTSGSHVGSLPEGLVYSGGNCVWKTGAPPNGEINMEAYNKISGLNPRTAIGQRADGAVIFVCIDGRQPSSMGGEYKDIIDIMVEYGAINACNMDGGSSTVMMYRDTYGMFGEAGQVRMMNSYSLLQTEPRKMPNFWMVKP